MNLTDSDFVLFGVPEQFRQDPAMLDVRWKELQREIHPDRFAGQGAAAQRAAMQWSVRVNEAYQRLKDPQRRAAYLCELRGAPIEAESNTSMPPEFLVQQLEWREALDEARDATELDHLNRELHQARQQVMASIGEALDQAGDPAEAARQVRALMFIERFAHDIEARFDQLGQ